MEFKKGDKVWVYDSAFKGGKSEVILSSDSDEYALIEAPGVKGVIWVHVKQLELIERPKTKVKLYQYAWKVEYCNNWLCSGEFFKNDEDFKKKIQSPKFFKRLGHTMIEVDDE